MNGSHIVTIDLDRLDAVELALLQRVFHSQSNPAAYNMLVALVGRNNARMLDCAALDAIDAVRKFDDSLQQ